MHSGMVWTRDMTHQPTTTVYGRQVKMTKRITYLGGRPLQPFIVIRPGKATKK